MTPPTFRGRYLTLEPIEERHALDPFEAMRGERDTVYFSILDEE